MLPPDEYYASLPKRRSGSGVLITNSVGQILLVEPTYKPTWETPGGVVEAGETPRETCVRECREELGLELTIGRLLVIDHKIEPAPRGDSIMFIYDGGELEDTSAIRLPAEELRSCGFVDVDALSTFLSEGLARRLQWAAQAKREAGLVEIENGVITWSV